jgi:uncharacterized SAM-binding protein YcdF (DUF218 family)
MPWSKIAGLLLAPPGLFLLVALLALLVGLRWRLVGRVLIAIDFVALALLSLPHTGRLLIAPLESQTRALPTDKIDDGVQAIVVLGGGRYADAPEYGGDTVSVETLERLRYAAALHRRTKLPLLVSGGSPFEEETPEAQLMKRVLEKEFGVEVKWVEDQSDNTLENAQRSKLMLTSAGVKRAYLVTHAWHMPRARWAFIHAGVDAVPAPTAFTTLTPGDRRAFAYVPSARGLRLSSLALRERMGIAWYRFRHDSGAIAPPDEKKLPVTTP